MKIYRKGGRERKRERQRDRERETERQKERQRERETERGDYLVDRYPGWSGRGGRWCASSLQSDSLSSGLPWPPVEPPSLCRPAFSPRLPVEKHMYMYVETRKTHGV